MRLKVPVELVEFTWAAATAIGGIIWLMNTGSKQVALLMVIVGSANYSMLFWRTWDRLRAPGPFAAGPPSPHCSHA